MSLEKYPLLKSLCELIRINLRVYPGFLLHTNYKVKQLRKLNNLPSDVVLKDRVDLAVVAIMKEEDKFIEEWLCFYLRMGVGHFYLYNNGDFEKTDKRIRPYVEQGLVTHIPFPDLPNMPYDRKKKERNKEHNMQYLAYGDFLIRYKQNAKWVLKVDLDEFVYPTVKSGHSSIAEYLEFLDADDVVYVTVPSFYFGASGHDDSPEGLVIESYTERRPHAQSYKCMARTDYILPQSYSTCHDFNLKPSGKQKRINDNKLLLNHYFTKSKEDFAIKTKCFSFAGKDFERFYSFNAKEMVKDEGDILQYVAGTKELINRYKS